MTNEWDPMFKAFRRLFSPNRIKSSYSAWSFAFQMPKNKIKKKKIEAKKTHINGSGHFSCIEKEFRNNKKKETKSSHRVQVIKWSKQVLLSKFVYICAHTARFLVETPQNWCQHWNSAATTKKIPSTGTTSPNSSNVKKTKKKTFKCHIDLRRSYRTSWICIKFVIVYRCFNWFTFATHNLFIYLRHSEYCCYWCGRSLHVVRSFSVAFGVFLLKFWISINMQ